MPTKSNGTVSLTLKIVGAILAIAAGGGLGFAVRPMVAEEDANTRVSIGILQSTQEAMGVDVKEHHDDIDTLKTGIAVINTKQDAAKEVHVRIEKLIEGMDRKIDKLPKSQ